MSERAGLLFAGLLLILVPSCVLGGECSGEGVFKGRGTFSGEGIFESEAGTFEGTGVFVGRNGASFEGSGSCEVSARVQAVEGTRINVTGNGMFDGDGIFEVEGVSFNGDVTVEGEGIAFEGVGRFEGEGVVEASGTMNVFGESFECTGSGVLAGAGTFDGEGSMRANGSFVGTGSLDGSGTLLGTSGSCEGSSVEFNGMEMDGLAPGPEDEEAIAEALEADI